MSELKPYEDNSYIYLAKVSNDWKNTDTTKNCPLPQGNMPMINFLSKEKQESLIKSYSSICSTCANSSSSS
jgi:hypothetical protein